MNIRALLKHLGPGFVTGASDDDPAGIGTYLQSGARFGYSQLWIALFSFPVMACMQEMCGRIGAVTGQGLAAVILNNYARPILIFIVIIQVVGNTINIGADLSVMAESEQLLWHLPYLLLLGFTTIATLALIVLVPYRVYCVYLKMLGLALLTYVFSAFTIHVDWPRALSAALIPHIEWNRPFLLMIVAVFGVTISTYEFFWQSSEEVEELVSEGAIAREEASRPVSTPGSLRFLKYDTIFGMFFSNVIMLFVIIVAAATLHEHGRAGIESAAEAARVLRPMAGPYASAVFSIGIVSSGLLAIPVVAGSSAYAVAGAFGWPRSLSKPFWQEWRFYGIIAGSCLIGVLVNLTRVPPFVMLFYSAVANGVISPPLLLIVTHIASNPKIMGNATNGALSTLVGRLLAAFMVVSLAALFVA